MARPLGKFGDEPKKIILNELLELQNKMVGLMVTKIIPQEIFEISILKKYSEQRTIFLETRLTHWIFLNNCKAKVISII